MSESIHSRARRQCADEAALEARRARRRARKRLLRQLFVFPVRRLRYRHLPIAMITGTKGKTTTTLMLAHIMREAGLHVGTATTDGVLIGTEPVPQKRVAGYTMHERVMTDPSINAAVLEVSRAMVLNSFYVDRCDVGALLNVGNDHIGMDGIESIEQMAALKRTVIDTARKRIVLNADDVFCQQMIDDYPVDRTTLFSFDLESPIIAAHLKNGGRAIYFDERDEPQIVWRQGDQCDTVIYTDDMPAAAGGIFRHNIANAMAAAALAEGLDISFKTITAGLRSFQVTIEHLPGRQTFIEGYPFQLMFDRACNPPSAETLAECLTRVTVDGRRFCAMTSAGDRSDGHFQELAAALANSFDYFVCYEQPKYRRNRQTGEINALIKAGLEECGVSAEAIDVVADLKAAVELLSAKVAPGDLVVINGGSIHVAMPVMEAGFAPHLAKVPADQGDPPQ